MNDLSDELRKLADAKFSTGAISDALRRAADALDVAERERGEYRNSFHDKIIECD